MLRVLLHLSCTELGRIKNEQLYHEHLNRSSDTCADSEGGAGVRTPIPNKSQKYRIS